MLSQNIFLRTYSLLILLLLAHNSHADDSTFEDFERVPITWRDGVGPGQNQQFSSLSNGESRQGNSGEASNIRKFNSTLR